MIKNRFQIFDNKPFGIRAAGIVLHDDRILLIRRVRDGQEFYVLPGGGVDPGETVQQGIARELQEETNQDVTVGPILYHLDFIDDSDQYYGLCRVNSYKEVKLTGEEIERHNEANQYHPQWVNVSDVPHLRVLPRNVKDWLLEDLTAIQNGETPFRHCREKFIRQSM